MRKETVDIVEDLFSEVNTTFTAASIDDNGDGTYVLNTSDTMYLQVKRDLTIGGKKYRITNIIHNESVTVKGKVLPTELVFEAYPVFYFHGKAVETNAELDMIDDSDNKTPMGFLVEIITDRFYPNDELKERETDIRIFFLTPAAYDDWTTNEHYDGAIRPMRNLAYNFLDVLEKSKIIGKFAQYDLTNHAKFGIFILRKGATKRIFDDNFSGVELTIRLPILKDLTCRSQC